MLTGRPRFSFPLRHHLLLLVVGVLLPLLIFSIFIVRQLAQTQRTAAERRLTVSASELANTFDRELASTFRSLDTLGQSTFLQRNNLHEFYDEATRVLHIQSSWSTIVLTDNRGVPLMNLQEAYGAPLPPMLEPDSLQEILRTQKPTVGTLRLGNEHTLAFPVRVPVIQDGTLRYVLTAVINVKSLNSMVAFQTTSSDEWTRTLLDSSGIIAARTRSPEKYVGTAATQNAIEHIRAAETGCFPNVSIEGEKVYVAFKNSRTSHWTAAVVAPASSLDGPPVHSLLVLCIIGGSLLLLTAGVAYMLSRRLGRGIASAARAAEDLALLKDPIVRPSHITEVTQLSEALLRSAQLLKKQEADRSELLAQANAARAEAEAANQAKDEFLAMLGHELRNPLAPMRTGVQLLGILPPGDPRIESTRQTIERQTDHMARLVDDLLDASRIRQHKFQVHRQLLNFKSLVSNVAADLEPELAKNHVTLTFNGPPEDVYVSGDRTRLAQSVGNLLHNSAKFTPPGGCIDITLTASHAHATLTVHDNGSGIDPAFLPHLFLPFAQGPQRLDRPHGGLGLGLALVKGFIEAHGGTVSAASEGKGKGATFTLTLPTTTDRPTPVIDPAMPRQMPHRRILLIEDMQDAARTLKLLLSLDGHTIEIADTGKDALDRAPHFRPEVIICDIGLPDIDGYTLCVMLRQLPALADSRFIALTGYGQSEDILRAAKAGFHIHLVKPVNIPRLRNAILYADTAVLHNATPS
jgi:signal transduction histidine kinase/ActR/RegA family two-component response regulator